MTRAASLSELSSSQADQAPAANSVGEQAIQLAAQLQGELDTLRDQLAWSNRLGQLGMLTAALAHETNNLLTPIGSYAQLALANPENSELAERALKAAVIGTKKAAKLVEGVMGLATPDGATANAVACLANEVVDDAVACMLPVAKQNGVNVKSAVDPIAIAIDALALEQVLINLISNACQAMSGMKRRRQIHIQSSESNGRLILQVIDSGPGVPQSVRGRLFEPFVTTAETREQPTETPTKQPPGSGLGLSICKQIIEAAGGQITLASSTKDGSIFEIELPLATPG